MAPTTRILAAPARRLRLEQGQTSSEYLGIVLLVALVIGAVVVTPLGAIIRDGLERAICEIGGGTNCGQAPREPEAKTCILRSADKSIEGSVKIFILKLEGGVKGVREERGDGSVRVTLEANAGAGIEISTPSVEIDADGEGEGEGTGKREVSVTGEGKLARQWVFEGGTPAENKAAADRFQDTVIDKAKALTDLNFFDDGPDLPPHEATIVQGGIEIAGKAEAKSGTGVEGNVGGSVGAIFNKNGDTTLFFEISGGAGLGASSKLFDFGGEAEGKVRLGITYDKDGKEKSAIVLGEAEGSFAAGVELEGGKFDEALDKVTENLEVSVGGRVGLNAKLDLTRPENRRALRAFMDGIDPVTGQPVSRLAGAAGLYERFRDDGAVSIQTYGVTGSNFGGGFDGSVIGAELKYEESEARLKDAWYLTDQGWRRWADCESQAP